MLEELGGERIAPKWKVTARMDTAGAAVSHIKQTLTPNHDRRAKAYSSNSWEPAAWDAF